MKGSVNEFNSRLETSKGKDSEIEGKLVELSNLKKKDVIMFFMIITSIVITTFTNTRRIMYKSAYI